MKAIQKPEIYKCVIFLILHGLLLPNLENFLYYFMIDRDKITKFEYSEKFAMQKFAIILSPFLFERFFKDWEVRTLIMCSMICQTFSSIAKFAFAIRLNEYLGIGDMTFVLFLEFFREIALTSFLSLPMIALFAKITPHHIEGAIFGLLTGIEGLSKSIISSMVGVWINERFTKVTAKDSSNYKVLCLIKIGMAVTIFVLLPLIPLKENTQVLIRRDTKKSDKETDEITPLLL